MTERINQLKQKHEEYLQKLDIIGAEYLAFCEATPDKETAKQIQYITEKLMMYSFQTDNMTRHMIDIIEELESSQSN